MQLAADAMPLIDDFMPLRPSLNKAS